MPDKFSYAGFCSFKLKIQAIGEQFETSQYVNDNVNTASAKEILNIYPEYGKGLHGTQTAAGIRYNVIKEQ